MGAIRILLIVLAGSQLFGCILIDWIPIRYEPLPIVQTESPPPENVPPPPPEPFKQEKPSRQKVGVEKETPTEPRKVSRREAVSPSIRDRTVKAERREIATEDPEAQYSLGNLYFRGEEVERDYTRALDLYLAAAQQGHAGALSALGHMHENGFGISPTPSEAAKWYSLAAGHGENRAMGALGYLSFTGFGIPRNIDVGLRWLRMAGKEDNVEAQLLLGVIYDTGWSVAEDDAEALKWYALAAERGDPLARFLQACMHALGEGTPLDLVNAARDYRLAAAVGVAEAQAIMDNRYVNLSGEETGLRWKQDLLQKRPRYAREPLEKFSRLVETYKAAALGDAEAMFGIGSFYWRGAGLDRDFDQAVKWWRLAARLGNKKAREFLARIDDFGSTGAVSEEKSPTTHVGQNLLPADLVYDISSNLLSGGGDYGEIRPSSAWMNMLRRSRELSRLP